MLTARQAEVLEKIEAGIAEHGRSPSYREMMTALDMISPSQVFRIVKALERRGFIRRTEYTARSIEVIRPQTHLNASYLRGYQDGYGAGLTAGQNKT